MRTHLHTHRHACTHPPWLSQATDIRGIREEQEKPRLDTWGPFSFLVSLSRSLSPSGTSLDDSRFPSSWFEFLWLGLHCGSPETLLSVIRGMRVSGFSCLLFPVSGTGFRFVWKQTLLKRGQSSTGRLVLTSRNIMQLLVYCLSSWQWRICLICYLCTNYTSGEGRGVPRLPLRPSLSYRI